MWFILALSVPVCSNPLNAIINSARTFNREIELAENIVDVITTFQSDEEKPVTKAEIDVVMHELSTEIKTSELNILRSILLQSRFERIDDAVIQITNSLQDLKNYINALSTSTRDNYKLIFIQNYENGELSLIRFLPALLTYQTPGRQGTLLTLLADDTRCNLTSLNEFKMFYFKLLSSGIGIDVAYKVMKFQMSKEDALSEWTKTLNVTESKFQIAEKHCKSLFTKYAKADVNKATSAGELHILNNVWKPWLKNDVFFTQSYGTFQFVYFEYEDDTVIWQRKGSYDKVSVFYQPDLYENRLPSNILADSTANFRSAIGGEDDDSAAKHVAQAVQNMLKRDGYVVESLVVLLDEEDSEEILDPDSPVVTATVDNVKLTYCYKSRVQCSIDAANIWESTETATGSFKIYLYAHNQNVTIQHSVHHTDSANSLAKLPAALMIASLSLTVIF